eukprot:gene22365-23501_t
MALAAILGGQRQAAAECRYPKIMYCDGCTVDLPFTITGGSPCRISQNFRAGIISMTTIVRPKHGIFAHASATDHAYLPEPGYRGDDYFEYEVVFRQQTGGTARTIVHTVARIQP